MPHLTWQALAVLALMALLAAPASAQGEPAANVAAQLALLKVGPDESRTVTWTVANTGQPVPVGLGQGEPTAAITLQVPEGWSASIGPGDQQFPLPAGSQRTISVVVSVAPTAVSGTELDLPDEGPAPADGALTLSMTLTDAAGRSSTASAPTTLAFLPPPTTIIEKDYTRAIVAGSVSGAVMLGLAVFLVVYLRRASQVALHVDPEQRPITSGTDGIFLVQVENRGRIRREVEVDVTGLPPTWYGAFSFPKVQLAPGERAPVPLCVKIPLGAPDGVQAELLLRARPSSRFPWLVQARTRIEAHDRVRIGKAEPSTQPAP